MESDAAAVSGPPPDAKSSAEDESATTANRSAFQPGWALLLLLVTFIAYTPALRCGYVWDDRDHAASFHLRTPEALSRIWFEVGATPQYYPLVHTTYWLEFQVWREDPLGYHLTNILLHGAAAILLYRLLAGLGVPGAALAAAVFALHPIQVESVVWTTERKNVLSGVCYFVAMLAYLRFAGLDKHRPTENRKWWYVASILAFVCAMLSKTVTATLPPALLLITWWKRGSINRRDLLSVIPFFVIGVPLGLLSAWMEKFNVGAKGPEWDFSLVDRFLIAGRVLWFYPSKLVSPTNLTFIYPRWDIDSSDAWSYGYPVSAIALILALWFGRHRLGRGPLTGVLFFAGTLFPALGFFDVYPMRYSFVADHFQYLAGIGLVAVVAGVIARRLESTTFEARLAAALLAGIVLCVLAALTWMQCHIYHDRETLWRDTIRKNPTCFIAHNYLGVECLERRELDQATKHFQAALKSDVQDPSAFNNLANVAQLRKDYDEAERYYRLAIESVPGHATLHNNYGSLLVEMKRFRAAEAQFRKSLDLQPDLVIARGNLADLLFNEQRLEEAEQHLLAALKLEPNNGELLQRWDRLLRARRSRDASGS